MKEFGCWLIIIAVAVFVVLVAFACNSRTVFIIG